MKFKIPFHEKAFVFETMKFWSSMFQGQSKADSLPVIIIYLLGQAFVPIQYDIST